MNKKFPYLGAPKPLKAVSVRSGLSAILPRKRLSLGRASRSGCQVPIHERSWFQVRL